MSLFWLSGPQPEAQHYLDQIADQRSREDEALQGHKRQFSVETIPRPSRPRDALGVPVALAQHPDEHRPERPVLLAVDQALGE
jgi:hypothetical protein